MALKKLEKKDMMVGKPLPWSVFDESGVLLLQQGYMIQTEAQLECLMIRGLYQEGDAEEPAGSRHTTPPKETAGEASVFDAFQAVRQVQATLERLLCEWQNQKDLPSGILSLSQELQQICRHDEDAALAATLMEKGNRYSISHCVHTALICEVALKNQKMSSDDRLSILSAALTMNIAMTDLQDRLYCQKEPLSEKQHGEVQRHPEEGEHILRELGIKDPVWLAAVQQHHEILDGRGYPHGLQAKDIGLAAKVVSLVDIYHAKISARKYRLPLPPNAAMRGLFLGMARKTDSDLPELFIKSLGIYPPGTPVRLRNKEIGVVTQRSDKAHAPTVHSIIGTDGTLLGKPLHRESSREEFSIQEALTWHQMDPSHLILSRLWNPALCCKKK